jgi:hypothetical protein
MNENIEDVLTVLLYNNVSCDIHTIKSETNIQFHLLFFIQHSEDISKQEASRSRLMDISAHQIDKAHRTISK